MVVALPLIAFSFTPAIADYCCVAPSNPECGAPLPCACYANASAVPSPPANLSRFYAPSYAEACGAQLQALSAAGAAGARDAAVGARDAACSAGSQQVQRWRFGASAAVMFGIGLFALLAVPPLRRTRRAAPGEAEAEADRAVQTAVRYHLGIT